MKLRVLELKGGPVARGARHGELFAADIRRYAQERVALAGSGAWSGRPMSVADTLALAEETLPAHAAYDAEVHAEMLAMAEAAGISPAEAVIVGGFTDFVDTVRARVNAPGVHASEDDCTAFIVPDSRMGGAGWYGQTWDMHESATEFVAMMDLRPDDGPRALVFTTVGCVGQIGMNEHGLAVGITNLTATDGRVGVTWPHVVRRMLREPTVEAALPWVLDAPLAGGHTFLLFDRRGEGAVVEAMPTWRGVTRLDGRALLHTNHCLAPEAQAREAKRAVGLVKSSVERLRLAEELLGVPSVDVALLEAVTREGSAICRRAGPPDHLETSGAALMCPKTGEFRAIWGPPTTGAYEVFRV